MVADDLVQETLMIALQRYQRLRDHERLNAWMYTLLSDCWKQYLRRTRATVDLDEMDICCEQDAEAGSSELEVVDRVRRATLQLQPGQLVRMENDQSLRQRVCELRATKEWIKFAFEDEMAATRSVAGKRSPLRDMPMLRVAASLLLMVFAFGAGARQSGDC